MSESDPPGRNEPAAQARIAALSAGESHFRAIFDHALDGMLLIDGAGRVLQINRAAYALFGLPPSAFLGHSLFEARRLLNLSTLAHMWKCLLADGHYRGELLLQRPDGTSYAIEVTAVANVLPDQHLAVVRDITARKHADAALRASEERFAKAFRASPDAISISHLFTGRILEVNDHWVEMMGYPREAAVGQLMTDLGIWVDQADQEQVLALLRTRGFIHEHEIRFRKQSGEIRAGLLSVELIELDGELCALAIQRDITARKRAEDALRASEERFAKAFRATPDAISITRIHDGIIVDVNDSWLRMTGYTRDAVIGQSVSDLQIWQDPVDRDRLIAQLREQGSVRDFEFLFHRRSAEVRQGLLSAELIELAGEPCLLVMIREVTEQKQTAAQLRLLGAAVQHASEAIILVAAAPDPLSRRVVFVNPAFTRLTGYTADEVQGRTLSLLHGPKTDLSAFEQAHTQPNYGQAAQGEMVQYRKDGSEYLAEWQLTLVRNDEGAVTHWMVLQRDITERRAMEERMRAAERLGALGRVAAGVAHEFNNILAGIMGRLDLLAMEIHEPGPQATLDIIQRAVEDGANVVRQIQAFSRLRVSSAFTTVPVSDLVRDVIALTQPRWQVLPAATGIAITMRTQVEQGLSIHGDSTELREVLTNLIYNAVEAMPGGGELIIQAEGRGEQVVLSIRDTGIGMDAATLERAFEPFFTTKVSGTGLGLPVIQDIVHRHGGTIKVVSVPGGGTRFTLTLPAATTPAAPPAPPPVPAMAGAARILVVDDDPGLSSMLRQMLVLAGHEVMVAASGAAALPLIEQYTFDLVCTDLGMPGMNGWDVARAVRQRAPGTPVVLVTGWGTDLDPTELAGHTVDFVLPKPFRVAQVHQLLAQALAERKGAPLDRH